MVTAGEPLVKTIVATGSCEQIRRDIVFLPEMSRPFAQNRKQLQAIARRAMTERGLEPDFPAAARAEADAITKPGADSSASIEDLTGLLWASIDNDDSRDLDQLSVAEPLTGGA